MRKSQKEQVVAELTERLKATDTLIVADYRGLSVTEIDGVRTELLSHGARFSVVKNTLTKRAADEAGLPELNELVDGPTAIAFVNEGDMVAVAKTLSETARRTRVLEIRGGILQGKPMSPEQVRNLAALPPVEALRGQVLGAIVAPLNAIAGLVNAPLQDLVGVLDARIDQLREQGDDSDVEPEATEATEAPETTEAPEATEATEEPVAESEEASEAPAEASAELEETKEEEE